RQSGLTARPRAGRGRDRRGSQREAGGSPGGRSDAPASGAISGAGIPAGRLARCLRAASHRSAKGEHRGALTRPGLRAVRISRPRLEVVEKEERMAIVGRWPRAIFYDSKTTLFDWAWSWREAARAYIEKYGLDTSVDDFVERWVRNFEGYQRIAAFGQYTPITG